MVTMVNKAAKGTTKEVLSCPKVQLRTWYNGGYTAKGRTEEVLSCPKVQLGRSGT